MIHRDDGTGRKPRAIQDHVFNWLDENWHKSKYHILQLSTGSGKSYIAKALQETYGGAIVVPNNNLLNQYISDYPETNYLRGEATYDCPENPGLNCAQVRKAKLPSCSECTYIEGKKKAVQMYPTIYNPLSLFYLENGKVWNKAGAYNPIMVIDEGHRLIEMLMLMQTVKFNEVQYPFSNVSTIDDLIEWLYQTGSNLRKAAMLAKQSEDTKQFLAYFSKFEQVKRIYQGIKNFPHNYAWYIDQQMYRKKLVNYLNIEPLQLPSYVLSNFFQETKKIVIMSATIFKPKGKTIAGSDSFQYLDLPSPIPVKNRQVYITPTRFTSKTAPGVIAKWIEDIWKSQGRPNTIVHLTYGMAKKIGQILPQAITHTSFTKEAKIAEFKANGGLFLACGCAEGVDLPNDECRLNLIPILIFPNYGSPVIQGKIRIYGKQWYDLETLELFIQQAGRSTRGETDYSTIVCGDMRLPVLIKRYNKILPSSFVQSIQWGKSLDQKT